MTQELVHSGIHFLLLSMSFTNHLNDSEEYEYMVKYANAPATRGLPPPPLEAPYVTLIAGADDIKVSTQEMSDGGLLKYFRPFPCWVLHRLTKVSNEMTMGPGGEIQPMIRIRFEDPLRAFLEIRKYLRPLLAVAEVDSEHYPQMENEMKAFRADADSLLLKRRGSLPEDLSQLRSVTIALTGLWIGPKKDRLRMMTSFVAKFQ